MTVYNAFLQLFISKDGRNDDFD